jgi:hypothetical protein
MREICFLSSSRSRSRAAYLAGSLWLITGCDGTDVPASAEDLPQWLEPSCTLPKENPRVEQLEEYDGLFQARLSDGAVYCWGWDMYGLCYGEEIFLPVKGPIHCARKLMVGGGGAALTFEDGATVLGSTLAEFSDKRSPYTAHLWLEDPPIIQSVDVTASSFLAVLDAAGSVWLWGRLGGNEFPRFTKMEFPTTVRALRGPGPLCGIGDDDGVYCVGPDLDGMLGLTSSGPAPLVETVTKLPIAGAVADFSAGIATACALLRDGSVECSRNNSAKVLGSAADGMKERRSFGVVVGAHGDRLKLSADGDGACVQHGGTIDCWGGNGDDLLMPGGPGFLDVPTRIEPFDDIVDFAVGRGLCVLRADQTIWCRNVTDSCQGAPRGEWEQVHFGDKFFCD